MTKWQVKQSSLIGRPRRVPKYDHKIPISWVTVLIFISAGSPEYPLSNEVWWPAQLQRAAKWQAENLENSHFHIKTGLFCLLLRTLSTSGVCQHPSSFWTVSQSFFRAYKSTIYHVREDLITFHLTSISIIFIWRISFFWLESYSKWGMPRIGKMGDYITLGQGTMEITLHKCSIIPPKAATIQRLKLYLPIQWSTHPFGFFYRKELPVIYNRRLNVLQIQTAM